MPDLFSYCIPIDDGAAPNPYWGVCTLVICKPAIRRVAQVGDWVVGTGSRRSPIGEIATQVVYAMPRNREAHDAGVQLPDAAGLVREGPRLGQR